MEPAAVPRDCDFVLPPGFRFLPTDEEVITYYLKEKVLKKPYPIMSEFTEIDGEQLYVNAPYRVAKVNLFRKKDWYFFAPLRNEHHDGRGCARLVGSKGYWLSESVDEPIADKQGNEIGLKNSLVYCTRDGHRTPWVMDEFRLSEEYSEELQIASKDLWIAGRIRWDLHDEDDVDLD